MTITKGKRGCPVCGSPNDGAEYGLGIYKKLANHIAATLQEAKSWEFGTPFNLLATTEEISNPRYRADLKRAVAAENIGEREWLTAIADALLHVDMKDGRIWLPMEPYPIPFVDSVIPNDRYMRDFMRSEQCTHVERDRLIDLYFRVFRAERARSFGT